jgi:hypothetical protein
VPGRTHLLREVIGALYVLAGSETHSQLVTEGGSSPDRFEEWLRASIRRLLLAT